jgi:type III secretion system YscQ/HrcQ family protein
MIREGAASRPRVRPYPLDRLPRLTRAQVDAGRVLLGHLPLAAGPDWSEACRALGGAVAIDLVEAYALPAAGLGAQLRGALVQLAATAGRWALVAIDPRLAPRLARRALGVDGDDERELPAPRALTRAEEGALEFLVAALVDGQPVRVLGVVGDEERAQLPLASHDGEAWLLVLEARISSPVGSGWARLIAPETLRLSLPPAHRAEALLARRDLLADALVSTRLELGRAALARADLGHLEAGDVVIFDRIGVRDARGGPVTLRLGRGGFRARLDGEALIIEEPFRLNLGAPIMDYESPPPKPDEAGTDHLLRELPVEVVCELGRVTMTGRELLELRPGAVIPVGRPLAGPVDLTVGGRVVARGELVDVEGEIGVRVSQICD